MLKPKTNRLQKPRKARLGGVLTRIVASYLALSFGVLACVLTVSTALFQARMRQEIESFNLRILEKTADSVDKGVFDLARRAYLDMVWQAPLCDELAFFASNPVLGNHDRLLALHRSLLTLVARSEGAISSIHVYYPHSGMLLSTQYGYRRLGTDGTPGAQALDWTEQARTGWLPTRRVPTDLNDYNTPETSSAIDQMSFIGRYVPARGPDNPCQIAINVDEAILSTRMREVMPYDYGDISLLAQNGMVLASTDPALLYTRPDSIADVHPSAPAGSNPRGDHIFSVAPLRVADWRMVSRISVRDFYAAEDALRGNLLVLGAGVFAAAALLSLLFSRRLYQPVRRLALKAGGLGGHAADAPGAGRDEYALIDTAIDHMLGKLDNLQYVLRLNTPAIRYEFVSSLLSGKLHAAREIEEQIRALGLTLPHTRYSCAVLSLDCARFRAAPFVERQFLQYSLIDALLCTADSGDGSIILLPAPYAGDRILLLLNSDAGDDAFERLRKAARARMPAEQGQSLRIACGEWVADPLLVQTQYRHVQRILEYGFFYPDDDLLWLRRLLPRDLNPAPFDSALLEAFEASLTAFDRENAAATLTALVDALQNGGYAAKEAHAVVLKVLSAFSNFQKSLKVDEARQIKQELYERFNDIDDIGQFRRWLLEYIDRLYAAIHNRNTSSKNRELVGNIRAHIDGHLGGDLSLDAMTARFYISQKHLCKIFKEETGETFSEYITRRRMEEAKPLLLEGRLSVEQIGETVGYNSPSYFIKKFHDFYGVTPKRYRVENADHDENVHS